MGRSALPKPLSIVSVRGGELKQNIRLTPMIVRQPDTVLTDGTNSALLLFAERQLWPRAN